MSSIRRSWKFQDFVAHGANVNCVALGHKSGRVLVTGGDDKKVNLWAVGKQSCFMSLSGHTTPVDCVQFNQVEELICAGSRAGALKVWDLEAAKLVRTLNGHKYAIKCIDFHPYDDLLVSGSADCSIKLWDSRKKGVLSTFNGHKGAVNDVKFSPDGQWIATGGEDSTIKIWDIRTCRVIKDFRDHVSPVSKIEFHPHEFLLASGSADRSVHYFDLENFNLVSSETDVGSVRCLCFNPNGECLFAGTTDCLKILGWEPNRLYDSVRVYWGKVGDISVASNQLIGASYHLTNVQIYVVDLKRCNPFSPSVMDMSLSPFNPNQSIRKSFSKADRPLSLKNRTIDVKTIEESTSGTDPEEDVTANITNHVDYEKIFRGRGLQRTPPLVPEPFLEPKNDDPAIPQILASSPIYGDGFEALSLDNDINNYEKYPSPHTCNMNRSKSNLDQVYRSRLSKQQNNRENILPNISKPKTTTTTANTTAAVPKFSLQRQSSCKDVPERGTKSHRDSNVIKHSVSEVNINKGSNSSRTTSLRKNSFSGPKKNSSSVPNVSRIPNYNGSKPSADRPQLKPLPLPQNGVYVNSRLSPEEEGPPFVPAPLDRPVGLDFNDFLPKNHNTLGFQQELHDVSEGEALGILTRGHEQIINIVASRQRSMKLVVNQYRSKDMKTAIETALAMDDTAVLVDILGVIINAYSLWNLDLCVIVLPKILDLLQSKYETYVTVACDTLKLILKHFGPVIRSNLQAPIGSFGVDIPREERYQKSLKCNESLTEIRRFLSRKNNNTNNNNNNFFREVVTLMQNCLD